MSVMKPPNSGESFADGLEDYPPDARLDAMYAAAEARLQAEFDPYRDDLLAILQKVCERTSKSFDKERAWDLIRLYAERYLLEEASVEEKRMVPAAERVERLYQLGNTLREARCKLDETRQHVTLVVLFEEWC